MEAKRPVSTGLPWRLGFTDANSSPDPQDYTQHGGIYLHLERNGQSFVNFGNGYEFAILDEDGATEPPACASTSTCRWKKSCATTATTSTPRTTRTSGCAARRGPFTSSPSSPSSADDDD
jgi:hypothetical protein